MLIEGDVERATLMVQVTPIVMQFVRELGASQPITDPQIIEQLSKLSLSKPSGSAAASGRTAAQTRGDASWPTFEEYADPQSENYHKRQGLQFACGAYSLFHTFQIVRRLRSPILNSKKIKWRATIASPAFLPILRRLAKRRLVYMHSFYAERLANAAFRRKRIATFVRLLLVFAHFFRIILC